MITLRTTRRRRAAISLGGLALLAILAACSSTTTTATPGSPGSPGSADTSGTIANPTGSSGTIDEGQPVDGGKIVIAVPADSAGYNPASNQWTDSGNLIGSSVLEPLAVVGADKNAQPWLALSWTPNSTNTSWTIKLRPGVTFSSKEKFNADAVKQNFDFFLKAPLTSLGLTLLDSVTVVDDLTVRLDMKSPWGAFPNSILDGPFYMMAPSMLAMPDQGQSHPIGTGPFVFDSWTHDSDFKVNRNPDYWQKGLPHLDAIDFRIIPDDSSRLNSLKSGDIDAMLSQQASAAQQADGFTVVKDWNSEAVFAQTNTAPSIDGVDNPFANIHARQALAYATDRETIASSIDPTIEVPTSPWPPESPWGMAEKDNGYVDFDLDKAKAEVAAYEKDTGKPNLTFTLIAPTGVDNGKLMQTLQAQWQAAGAVVNLQQMEESPFISQTITSKYQIAISRNYAFADPDTNYAFWSSTTAKGVGKLSINMTQYTTPTLDQSLEKGRQSTDVNVRKDAYHDVTRELNAGKTNIWIYRTPYSFISTNNVKGWNTARVVGFASYGPRAWLGELWHTN
jgi:peptide/nickel transport system substrate-binding protein